MRPALATVVRHALRLALALLATPAWLPYLALRPLLGRPPHLPPPGTFAACLRLALGPLPAPGLPLSARLVVVAACLERWLLAPLPGLAWHLDTLLFGRALSAVRVDAPLFELSAARSGSTQLGRYLEEEPDLVAPSLLQVLFPYRWLWLLVRPLAARVPEERVRAWFAARVPADYLARHELDPLRTDTFEIPFANHHLGDLFHALGPSAWPDRFGAARLTATNRDFWERDFLAFLDALGRKALLHAGGGRLFVKGHFLAVGPHLAARHPDARFLTVLREPTRRVRSVVNFHRSQPGEAALPAVPWPWLVEGFVPLELDYCEAELAFYGGGDPRRVVVRFEDYVADLGGTLRRVYPAFLGRNPPVPLRAAHAPRARAYAVDRSLEELGAAGDVLAARLGPYERWRLGEAQGEKVG